MLVLVERGVSRTECQGVNTRFLDVLSQASTADAGSAYGFTISTYVDDCGLVMIEHISAVAWEFESHPSGAVVLVLALPCFLSQPQAQAACNGHGAVSGLWVSSSTKTANLSTILRTLPPSPLFPGTMSFPRAACICKSDHHHHHHQCAAMLCSMVAWCSRACCPLPPTCRPSRQHDHLPGRVHCWPGRAGSKDHAACAR
jgi:hypothetical protein